MSHHIHFEVVFAPSHDHELRRRGPSCLVGQCDPGMNGVPHERRLALPGSLELRGNPRARSRGLHLGWTHPSQEESRAVSRLLEIAGQRAVRSQGTLDSRHAECAGDAKRHARAANDDILERGAFHSEARENSRTDPTAPIILGEVDDQPDLPARGPARRPPTGPRAGRLRLGNYSKAHDGLLPPNDAEC